MYRHAAAGPARRARGPGGGGRSPSRGGAGEESFPLQIFSRSRRGRPAIVPGSAADRPRRAPGRSDGADAGAAAFSRKRNPHAGGSRGAGGPGGKRGAHARSLHRAGAGRLWTLARNLWWSWDNDSTSLFLDLDPQRWRQLNHNPIALLSEIPLAKIERRAGELVLHGRINYAYRRQREYLEKDRTWGARHAGILRPRPVAYFSAEFGLHESIPDLFRRPGSSRGRSSEKRVGPRAFRWSPSDCSTDRDISASISIRPAGSRRTTLQTDVNQRRWNRPSGANGEPVMVQIETRGCAIARQSLAHKSGAHAICCCSIPTSRATPRKTANSPRAYTAATAASASGRNCCWAWADSAL